MTSTRRNISTMSALDAKIAKINEKFGADLPSPSEAVKPGVFDVSCDYLGGVFLKAETAETFLEHYEDFVDSHYEFIGIDMEEDFER